MKQIKYFCDKCGREIDTPVWEVATIKGDWGRNHYNHVFSMHLCPWCYPVVFNLIYDIMGATWKKGRIKMAV